MRAPARWTPACPWRGWRGALQRWGLAPVKDPLTLLAGFELLLEAQPAAHLTMVYGEADLLPQVEARLAASARLRERVTFHGFRTQAELAGFYRAVLRGAVPAAAGRRRLGARRGGGGSGAGRSVAGAFAPGFRTATSETLGCSGS